MSVGTRDLVLYVAGIDYSASAHRAAVRSVPSDSTFVSFEEARSGGKRDYHLAIVLNQNMGAGSLHRVIWTQRGTDVVFELWPYGRPAGGVPTAGQPRCAGTATVADPDGDVLGGDPDDDPTATMTTEVAWLCTAKPVWTPA